MPDSLTNSRFSILHYIPFSACITNSAHEFVAVNEAFCRLYRLRPDEVLGKTPWIVATSDFSRELSKQISDSVGVRGWWSGRITNRRSDGERLKLHLAALKVPPSPKSAPQIEELRLGVVVRPEETETLLNFSLGLNVELAAKQDGQHESRLTERQAEVMRLTRAGLKMKEVAAVLGIAPSTARVHLSAATKIRSAVLR